MNEVVREWRRLREPLAQRLVDLDDLRLELGHRGVAGLGRGGHALVLLGGVGLAVGERLADLAVVAVDRGGLEAELPRLEEDVLDLLDRGGLGQVDRLGDRAGEERLAGRHHPDVAHRLERAGAHRGVEDLVVLLAQAGGVDDVAVLGDVGDDRLDLLGLVAHLAQRARDGLVDDLHRAAADQLLELDQREVRLDAGGVAVHHEADGVVADEAGCHVGDVLRHGEVERRLHAAVLVGRDPLEEVAEGVCQARVVASRR